MQINLFEIKEVLKISGDDLLTRPIAKKFVIETVSKIKAINDPKEGIEFNFEKVKTSDTSFIDELIIVNVLQAMKNHKIARRGIFVTHLSPSTSDNMESVFGQKRIPLLRKKEHRDFDLFGHLEKHLVQLLKSLFVKKNIRAIDVANEYNFTMSVASTKLAKLYQYSLANRVEEISEKGREYSYFSMF